VTYPNQQPPVNPRPGPPPGGFRPGPPPGGFRPGPPQAQPQAPAYRPEPQHSPQQPQQYSPQQPPAISPAEGGGTGHPAVDAVLQSLANAAALAPADQIAEYEAAHQVLQETLASIDR
jgi:hypothetical protein